MGWRSCGCFDGVAALRGSKALPPLPKSADELSAPVDVLKADEHARNRSAVTVEPATSGTLRIDAVAGTKDSVEGLPTAEEGKQAASIERGSGPQVMGAADAAAGGALARVAPPGPGSEVDTAAEATAPAAAPLAPPPLPHAPPPSFAAVVPLPFSAEISLAAVEGAAHPERATALGHEAPVERPEISPRDEKASSQPSSFAESRQESAVQEAEQVAEAGKAHTAEAQPASAVASTEMHAEAEAAAGHADDVIWDETSREGVPQEGEAFPMVAGGMRTQLLEAAKQGGSFNSQARKPEGPSSPDAAIAPATSTLLHVTMSRESKQQEDQQQKQGEQPQRKQQQEAPARKVFRASAELVKSGYTEGPTAPPSEPVEPPGTAKQQAKAQEAKQAGDPAATEQREDRKAAAPQPAQSQKTAPVKAKAHRVTRKQPHPSASSQAAASLSATSQQRPMLSPQVAQQWNHVRRRWDLMHQQWQKPVQAIDFSVWQRRQLEDLGCDGSIDEEDISKLMRAQVLPSQPGSVGQPSKGLLAPMDREAGAIADRLQSSASSGVLPIDLHLPRVPGRTQSAPFGQGLNACCTVPPLDNDPSKNKAVSNQTWVSFGTRLDTVWRVLEQTWIRKELPHSSARIYPLRVGDEITVTALVKEELRIISPAVGWVSLVSDAGEPLVTLARQGDEPAQNYPSADLSEAFFAAVDHGDVVAATTVAHDLIDAKEVTAGHFNAALLALASGHTAWRELCEQLDENLHGSASGTSAELQKAICHAEAARVEELLQTWGEALAATLPPRHLAMAEVLCASAAQRSKASAREEGHMLADRRAWERVLRGAASTENAAAREAVAGRIQALGAPQTICFVVSSSSSSKGGNSRGQGDVDPRIKACCGNYEYVGEENGFPAYRLGGKASNIDKACLLSWRKSGMWGLGGVGTEETPVAVASGGWLPPLTGWRLHGGRGDQATTGNVVALEMLRAGAYVQDAQSAVEHGDLESLLHVAAKMAAAPSWLVMLIEDKLKVETDTRRIAAWQAVLRSWRVSPERIASLVDMHRYREFPKLDGKSAWRLLSLCRIQAKEERRTGVAVDLLSMDASSNAPSVVMFDRSGVARITAADLRKVLQSLEVPPSLLEGSLAEAVASAGGRGVLDVAASLQLLAQLLRSEKQQDEDHILAALFKSLDHEGAGRLGSSELKPAMKQFELVFRSHGLSDFCIAFTEEEVKDMLKEAKVQDGGVISIEEFKAVMWSVIAA